MISGVASGIFVYIAKYKTPHIDKKTGKEIWWTATGTLIGQN